MSKIIIACKLTIEKIPIKVVVQPGVDNEVKNFNINTIHARKIIKIIKMAKKQRSLVKIRSIKTDIAPRPCRTSPVKFNLEQPQYLLPLDVATFLIGKFDFTMLAAKWFHILGE